jgi:hypothetical protein
MRAPGTGEASATAPFAYQALMHEHLEQGLIAQAFALSQLAGLCDIGFR